MKTHTAHHRLHTSAGLGVAVALTIVLGGMVPAAQENAADDRRSAYDQILDANVRDGFVYYRALKAERRRLDAYIVSIGSASVESETPQEQIAFWLNAYNALVLRTVIDNYPITQRSKEYPPQSIRQIPGAFERLSHRVAGKTLTLDQIETTILPSFHDPRLYLALGRGAIGSGRLRSEAFSAANLEKQLAEVASECATRSQCVQVDPANTRVLVSSIFSWRRTEFIDAYSDKSPGAFTDRSPIERAVLSLVAPKMLTTERDFLAKNTFKLEYLPFDWSLNDLTGRGGR
jgi:hypothetical protein